MEMAPTISLSLSSLAAEFSSQATGQLLRRGVRTQKLTKIPRGTPYADLDLA